MPIIRRVIYANLSYDLKGKLDERNLERRRQRLRPEKPPGRQLFVERLEGHALPWLPVFQVAPLAQHFREIIAKERDLLIKEVRLERDRDPEAIIIKLPQHFVKAWQGLQIPSQGEYSFTRLLQVPIYSSDWLGMSRDKTWVTSKLHDPPELEDVRALSLYVNQLVGLDENGVPPRRPRQRPIPDDDAEALGDLAP